MTQKGQTREHNTLNISKTAGDTIYQQSLILNNLL